MDKTKTRHLYAACKKFTSDVETHTDWKWRQKKVFQVNWNQQKAWAAILKADKRDFKTKTAVKDKEGCNKDKEVN